MSKHKNTLTTGEAASYCGVNFRTIIRWIEKGRLKAYSLPGRGDKRIPVNSFIQFLRENQLPIPDELLVNHKRILIVEDQVEVASAIERILKRAGFETQIALDGFMAGSLLHFYKPRLMTLDLKMPGVNGHQVLKFARTQEHLAQLKILVLSAQPDDELQLAVTNGADMAMAKPFDNQELLNNVELLMQS